MRAKAGRLLRLLEYLVSAESRGRTKEDILRRVYGYEPEREPEGPGDALARRLWRDMEDLRAAGLPVHVIGEAHGDEPWFRFELKRWRMPPLGLDTDDARAVRQLISTTHDPIMGVGMAKLFAALSQETADVDADEYDVDASPSLLMEAPIAAEEGPDGHDARVAGRIGPLAAAIAARKRVGFRYDAVSGTTEERLVEPYVVAPRGDGWYLIGRDVDRGAQRVFRVVRMGEVKKRWKGQAASVPDFEVPAGLDIADALDFRSIATVDASFAVPPVRTDIVLPDGSEHVGETADGWSRYEVVGCSERVLTAFALRSVPDVELLEPSHIRQRVAEALRDVVAAHSAGTVDGP